ALADGVSRGVAKGFVSAWLSEMMASVTTT
ncbi:unnamed protein product, partial [marine sediment metagenome]